MIHAFPDFFVPDPILASDLEHPLESLQAAWRAAPDLIALASDGKLHEWRAPGQTALPYATAMEVSDTLDGRSTGDATVRRVTLQVSCHASTPKAAKDMGGAISAYLDRQPDRLGDLSRWSLENAECNTGLLTKGEGLAPGGRDCHVQTVDIELFYSRA
jgi:hypothetical protein